MMTNLVLSMVFLTAAPEKKEAVPSVMYQFLFEVTELQPYFSSSAAYKSPKNREKVQSSLNDLEQLSKGITKHERLDDPIFQTLANQLERHLRRAASSYREGRYDYSRRLFHEALDGCASCHSQVKADPKVPWTFDESRIRGSDFEQAEFWYSVRQYEKALKLYDQVITNFDPKKSVTYELDTALARTASSLVRVYLDLDRAQIVFNKYTGLQKLPLKTRQRLRIWADSAERIANSDLAKGRTLSGDELVSIASKFFSQDTEASEVMDAHLVEVLYLSGLLYSHVHQKDALSPEILFYLAKCEEVLGDQFLRSVSNLYLRRCILQYPSSPVAQECFKELKSQVELEFTGSSGTDIPTDIQSSLDELEKRLKVKKGE